MLPVLWRRPIRFETDRFVGSAAIWVRDLPSAPEGLFSGKRRRSRVSIQGQFKCGLLLILCCASSASGNSSTCELPCAFVGALRREALWPEVQERRKKEQMQPESGWLWRERVNSCCAQTARLHGGRDHGAGVFPSHEHARPLAGGPGVPWHRKDVSMSMLYAWYLCDRILGLRVHSDCCRQASSLFVHGSGAVTGYCAWTAPLKQTHGHRRGTVASHRACLLG